MIKIHLKLAMDLDELKKLSHVLQENGDKILDGSCKLALTSYLLKSLNDKFELYLNEPKEENTNTFQVITTSTRGDIFHNLEFLHDFIQKTIGLKIINPINLGQKNNESIPQSAILDISRFRSLKILELKSINVNQISGLKKLRQQINCIICTKCTSNTDLFDDLFKLCSADQSTGFVWNELKECVMSYNLIEHLEIDSFKFLPFLQILDLSHNKIKDANVLKSLTLLKHLNLSFNKLECVPIFTKQQSNNLQTLILKNNYIEDLTGLILLTNLRELDLSCNCIVEHQHLASLLSLLNLQWLSLAGNPISYHPLHRKLTAKYLHSNTASVKFVLDYELLSKSEKTQIGSYHLNSFKLPENIKKILSSTENLTTNLPKQTEFKKNKVRNAKISESGDALDELTTSYSSNILLDTSQEYLEIKKQIEQLRELHGNEWLKSQNSNETFSPVSFENVIASIETNEPKKADLTNETLYESAIDITQSVNSLFDNETGNETQQIDEEDEIEEEPVDYEDDKIFIVKSVVPNNEQLFLCISEKENTIRERNLITSKVVERWSLSSLLKYEKNDQILTLKFDTVNRNKQTRQYIPEESDAQALISYLNETIQSRLENVLVKNQINYKCMKCEYEFSKYSFNNNKKGSSNNDNILNCPSCNSTVIIECQVKKENKFVQETIIAEPNVNDANKIECGEIAMPVSSSSESSIETTDSMNDIQKRHDSDIEVLTDPSQDGIEILNQTQSRNSSEERNSNKILKPQLIENQTVSDIIKPVINLLESSFSSGYMTDSVCTGIENKNGSDKIENGQSTPKKIQQVNQSGPLSIIEGLIQAVTSKSFGDNSQTLSQSPKPNNSQAVEFSFTNFSNVDHRVKLYLYMNCFEDEQEELIWLIKTKVLLGGRWGSQKLFASQKIDENGQPFNGLVVLSNYKLYLLKIDDKFLLSDEPIQWLNKFASFTIDRLESIFALPWKQGIAIKLNSNPNSLAQMAINENSIYVLCILQDLLYTSSFLAFLAESTLPENCQLKSSTNDTTNLYIQEMLASLQNRQSDENQLNENDLRANFMSIFNSCEISCQDENLIKLQMGVILLTPNDIILTTDNLNWLIPESKTGDVVYKIQPLANIIELECDKNIVTIKFFDESLNSDAKEECWTFKMETETSMEGVIAAIRTPWEALFELPLQVVRL